MIYFTEPFLEESHDFSLFYTLLPYAGMSFLFCSGFGWLVGFCHLEHSISFPQSAEGQAVPLQVIQ